MELMPVQRGRAETDRGTACTVQATCGSHRGMEDKRTGNTKLRSDERNLVNLDFLH